MYRELLDDPAWFNLDPVLGKTLINLWLLASEDERCEGHLPDPETTAFRLRIPEAELRSRISALVAAKWLEAETANENNDASTLLACCYHDATPETETKTETETYLDTALRADHKKKSGKSRRAKTIPLPEGWCAPSRATPIADSLKVDLQETEGRFRDYLASTGKQYVDYDAAFCNFVRNQPKYNGLKNVSAGPRQLQDNKLSVSKAIDGMQEQVRAGTIQFSPRPRLVPVEGEGDRRLLSKR